jgi:disulfide bond formation protein DsbB
MVKRVALFGLMVIGGFSVLIAALKVMMGGILLATIAIFLQTAWALYALAVAMDKNFEIAAD